jgi:hypothetical protein
VIICGIIGGLAGMYSAVNASNELNVKEKISMEARLVRVETKVDLILQKISTTYHPE